MSVGSPVEHHLQLAADGDELPAFARPGAGHRRREDVQAAGDAGSLGRLADPRQGRLEQSPCSGGVPSAASHRVAQVVGTDEHGVDAGHGVDLVGDLDGLDVLGLDDDEDLVVGAAGNIRRPWRRSSGHACRRRPIGCRAADTWSPRRSTRASAASITIGATIPMAPQSRTILMYSCLPGGDAGQGDATGVGDGAEHVGGGLDVGVGVLHVHGQPGEPDPRHEPCGGDAPQRQPGADLGLARPATPA